MKEQFPFGIDDIILVDSSYDFRRINNLTTEMVDLIIANDFIQKTQRENPNKPKVFLRDSLIHYFNELSSKYPDIVFFELRKATTNFQFGDKKSGIKYLEQAHQKHPNHYLPKILLAVEYVQIPDVKKVYEVLGISEDQDITSIKDVFPNVDEMIKSEYLQFMFTLMALYNIKAGEYHFLGIEDKKKECIERVYEFVSTMSFIDESNPITRQAHDFLKNNKNYN